VLFVIMAFRKRDMLSKGGVSNMACHLIDDPIWMIQHMEGEESRGVTWS